jgi:DNA uptake protein ComE-like DNA-binding protein
VFSKKELTALVRFSKKERVGVYVVLFISALGMTVPTFFQKDPFPETVIGVTQLQIEEGKAVLIKRQGKILYTRDSLPVHRELAKRERAFVILDMNKADSAAFEKLPGIGEKLSSRIVKYRTKLGGFIDVQQLKEVYGIQDSVFATLQKYLVIENEFLPTRININTVEYAGLRKHPYADHQFVKLILAYRNMHGPFTSVENLKTIETLDTLRLQKIAPYLWCEN